MPRKPSFKADLADASGKVQPASTEKKVQPSREKTVLIGIHKPEAVRRQLKQTALDHGMTTDAVLSMLLNEWFAKNGKPEIA